MGVLQTFSLECILLRQHDQYQMSDLTNTN